MSNTLYFVDSSTERQLDSGYCRKGSEVSPIVTINESKTTNNIEINTQKDFIDADLENKIEIPKLLIESQSSILRDNDEEILKNQLDSNFQIMNGNQPSISNAIYSPKPSRAFHFPSVDLQLLPLEDEDSTGYESSQLLQDDSQLEDVALEIRSEPNLSPPLVRDYYNSDYDSTSSSFEGPASSQTPLKQLFRRPKLLHSLSQQIKTKQKTIIHYHYHRDQHHNHHHNRGHHRSTSEPSLVQMGVSNEVQDHSNIPKETELCEIPSHGYTLTDITEQQQQQQESQKLEESQELAVNQSKLHNIETVYSTDISASSDIILSPSVHSMTNMISPFMKKSLSLDYALNTINNYIPSSASPTENSGMNINSNFSLDLISLDSQSHIDAVYQSITQDPTLLQKKAKRIGPLRKKHSLSTASKTLSETTWSILRQQVIIILERRKIYIN